MISTVQQTSRSFMKDQTMKSLFGSRKLTTREVSQNLDLDSESRPKFQDLNITLSPKASDLTPQGVVSRNFVKHYPGASKDKSLGHGKKILNSKSKVLLLDHLCHIEFTPRNLLRRKVKH